MTNGIFPEIIIHTHDLKRLAKILQDQPVVAVDTESNSLYAYRERVCLVQFTANAHNYLVDPLAFNDLEPLAPLFAAPKIEKIFHAAEYDLLCLRRDFGFEFANIFDTMVAARILGKDAVGLGSVLEEEFGIKLDKRYQRANWGQRPLSSEQLEYARLDTQYLIPLRTRLYSKLVERELWPLAREDFDRLANTRWEENGRIHNGDQPLDCWRISGSRDLPPQKAAVLHELCAYRDEAARSLDRPLFKVIGDKTLLAIAEELPQKIEQLAAVPGMTPGQVRRYGGRLLQAVQRGLKAKPIKYPRPQRQDEKFLERLEKLRNWRKATAKHLGVQSDIVLPRDLMQTLAMEQPQNSQALAALMQDVPWRFEHFASQILEVINHRKST